MADVLNNNKSDNSKNFSPELNGTSRIKDNLTLPANSESKVTQSLTSEEEVINVQGLTEEFMKFLTEFKDKNGIPIYQQELERVVRERKHIFMINYKDLKRFNEALAKKFENEPEKTIDEVVRYLLANVIIDMDKDFGRNVVKDFTIGITGYDDIILSPSQVSIDYLDRLITVEGVVAAVEKDKKRHVLVRAVIYYYKDGDNDKIETTEPQLFKQDYLSEDKIYDKFCEVCKKRPVKVEFSEYDSIATDRRLAILQDKPENMREGQTIPGSIVLVLTREFTDMLNPGDVVRVTGFLRTRKLEEGAKNTEDYYFVVTGIEYQQMPYSDVMLSIDDLRKIEELRKNPKKLMRDFIDSIAPTVYGLDKVKEGVALTLVSSDTIELPDGEDRGNLHMLIIGEPGVGKTRLLRAVQRIAPKSIYVSGESATKVGLSAGLVKDENTGEWMIEAGALALADRGVALIDEIDKLNPQDIPSLREAMESQTITVTKIKKTKLNARTSIIAAGNPKGDTIPPRGNIFQYVDISKSILTRFDLIFVVRHELDENKIRFIFESTIKRDKTTLTDFMYNPPIPPELMKKIIVYARTRLSPKFTKEAFNEIIELGTYLTKLANEYPNLKRLISDRIYGSLRRLAIAYAKLQLKEEVGVEEVKMAYDILTESLKSLGVMSKSEEEE